MKVTKERDVYKTSKSAACNAMPEGTEFVYFDKDKDLEEGAEVVVKDYSGLYRGVITAVTDAGMLEINEKAFFTNNVLYRIV
jgi:hypothetical protein